MADPVYALVRNTSVPQYGEGQTSQMSITPRGEQIMVQGLPSKTALTSLGKSWSCQMATGSAYTNVAGMPTTRAELALYNGYSAASGVVLVIDTVWMLSLTSITAASGITLIYQVGSPAALTDDTAQLINSPVGLTYSGLAKRAVAVTTMTANKWAVLNSGVTGAAASIGHGIFAEVNGGIHVRPGYTLGLNAIAGTAVGTSLIGVSWHEAIIPQGL